MEEKYLSYFDEFAKEDKDHIITICETASKFIWERFRARFDDPKLLAVTFSKIYSAFLNKLESLESEYSDFKINICNRLEMGYSTNEDEDDEKQGNFMVFIRHLNTTKKNEENDDPTAKAKERAAKKRAETDELYDAVFIELTLEPQTADEILERIEIEDATKAKIQARLKKMIDKGVVEKTDVKRDKRTIKGYYLVG